MKNLIVYSALTITFLSCNSTTSEKEEDSFLVQPIAAVDLMGNNRYAAKPSDKILKTLEEKRLEYMQDTSSIEKLIWYGRFLAYAGQYDQAINLYNKGIELKPDDDRLYRHKGHRQISIRKFNEAIETLTIAAGLIEGKENELEPDGMPNDQNIPVSTSHGNIYYHLGLAYYLKGDFESARDAYIDCLNTSTNADNIVSSTHWLYMIYRRLGDQENADRALEPITENLEVIENSAYYNLCLFYKGLISESELIPEDKGSGSDAVLYGLANWYFYNGNEEKAMELWDDIYSGELWNSFGYIASEAELYRNKNKI